MPPKFVVKSAPAKKESPDGQAAPAKKKPVPKKRTAPVQPKNIVIETKMFPVYQLKYYYKNPRIGNVDKIAESLQENGQYKPLVVNLGTKTGRRYEVLAGNHTLKGGRKNEWQEMLCSFVDVDNKRAAKINLVDNRLNDDGSYDEKVLAEIFSMMSKEDAVVGTGYTAVERDDYLALMDKEKEKSRELLKSLEDRVEDAADYEAGGLGGRPGLSDGELAEAEDGGRETPTFEDELSLEQQSEYLDGSFQLSNDVFFLPGWGQWDIPHYRRDMLAVPEDLPEKLIAWAGSATRDIPENEDPETFWIYNFGIDSTSGMNHKKNIILSFYADDPYFSKWMENPAKWTSKAINTGVKLAISPNFSVRPEQPGFIKLQNVYNNRYLGRYFQEAGIKVIPNIEWPLGDDDFLRDYVLKSLPRDIPVISLQGNSVVNMNVTDRQSKKDRVDLAREYRMVADHFKSCLLLFYGGVSWHDFVRGLKLPCQVRYVENRITALRARAHGRDKNPGL